MAAGAALRGRRLPEAGGWHWLRAPLDADAGAGSLGWRLAWAMAAGAARRGRRFTAAGDWLR